MEVSSPQLEPITYRNFNLCPHCVFPGRQSLLSRLCEGIPMISRSDGNTLHLLLADYPARYPAERTSGNTQKTSVCFWYSHVLDGGSTCSTVVILHDAGLNDAGLFRFDRDCCRSSGQATGELLSPAHVMRSCERRPAGDGVLIVVRQGLRIRPQIVQSIYCCRHRLGSWATALPFR